MYGGRNHTGMGALQEKAGGNIEAEQSIEPLRRVLGEERGERVWTAFFEWHVTNSVRRKHFHGRSHHRETRR